MNSPRLQYVTMTEDEFIERFRPVPNHLDRAAAYDLGHGGCLFTPSPKEFRHVAAQPRSNVWTMIEEDGRLFIQSGRHLVNRLGYLVTELGIDTRLTYIVPREP